MSKLSAPPRSVRTALAAMPSPPRALAFLAMLCVLVSVRSLAAQSGPPASGVPSGRSVQELRAEVRPGAAGEPAQRLALGRALARDGHDNEAMEELLWCFDFGHRKDKAFWSTRLGAVLDALGELAARYPAARTELVRRRDAQDARVRAGALGNQDIAELLALDEVLGDTARSVATYDDLLARHARGELTFFYEGVRDELWRQKRYRALADGRPDPSARLAVAAVALREATKRLAGAAARPDPAYAARVVADVCRDVEARFALGEVDVGNRLADGVIAFSPAIDTYARLIAHVERAGSEQGAARLQQAALRSAGVAAADDVARCVAEARDELRRRLAPSR